MSSLTDSKCQLATQHQLPTTLQNSRSRARSSFPSTSLSIRCPLAPLPLGCLPPFAYPAETAASILFSPDAFPRPIRLNLWKNMRCCSLDIFPQLPQGEGRRARGGIKNIGLFSSSVRSQGKIQVSRAQNTREHDAVSSPNN